MTGGLSFSGVSLEEALAAESVFVAAVSILCGVDEDAVTVTISAERRRRLLDEAPRPRSPGAPRPRRESDYAPTAAPVYAPTVVPSSMTPVSAPTSTLTSEGVVVAYEVAVPSLTEAEAVSDTISTTTVEDVNTAVSTAAAASNETVTLQLVATAVGAVEVVAARTASPTPVTRSDSSGGASSGIDAAVGGGAAAGAAVLLLVVGAFFYRRRGAAAAEEALTPRDAPRVEDVEGRKAPDLAATGAAARAQLAELEFYQGRASADEPPPPPETSGL